MNPVEPAKRSKTLSYEVSGPSEANQHDGASPEGLPPSEDGSLSKVRDILFGAQSREFDQRLHALENRLLQESANSKEEVTRSLASLKAHFTDAISQLKRDLQQEQAGRSTSLDEVGQVIQKLSANMEHQFSQLHQQTTQQHVALEQQITQQKTDLSKSHEQQMVVLQQQFQEKLQLLQKDKTDRSALAEMLMDVALRLKVGPREDASS